MINDADFEYLANEINKAVAANSKHALYLIQMCSRLLMPAQLNRLKRMIN